MSNYRVQDKENVTLEGEEATSFKLFEKAGESHVFKGEYFAPGWDLSDAQCVGSALDQDDGEDVFEERRRGAPKKMTDGQRRNIYIDDANWERAQELGSGNASEGIRIAIEMACTVQKHMV